VIVLAIAGGFLIGSIPFGYVIGRAFYGTDIRKHGSGNIGAMNALRTMGKTGALAVLLLDALKGFLPAFFVLHWLHATSLIAAVTAVAAVAAHCFAPWLRWRGGKGVATSYGAVLALSWIAGAFVISAWLVGAASTRYSSVGSLLGTFVAPFALWFVTHDPYVTAYGVVALVIVTFAHRDNIIRLREGRENPIRLNRSTTSSDAL